MVKYVLSGWRKHMHLGAKMIFFLLHRPILVINTSIARKNLATFLGHWKHIWCRITSMVRPKEDCLLLQIHKDKTWINMMNIRSSEAGQEIRFVTRTPEPGWTACLHLLGGRSMTIGNSLGAMVLLWQSTKSQQRRVSSLNLQCSDWIHRLP
jgi:hypothetical protein